MKPGDLYFLNTKYGLGFDSSKEKLHSDSNYEHTLKMGDFAFVIEENFNSEAMDEVKVLTRFGVLWTFTSELARVGVLQDEAG